MPTDEKERDELAKKVLTTLYELWGDQYGCQVTVSITKKSQKGPAA